MPADLDHTSPGDSSAAYATALLVVDMISIWDLSRGRQDRATRCRHRAAHWRAEEALHLRRHPDHLRQRQPQGWRSEFGTIVRQAARESAYGAEIARTRLPGDDDYAVLTNAICFSPPAHKGGGPAGEGKELTRCRASRGPPQSEVGRRCHGFGQDRVHPWLLRGDFSTCCARLDRVVRFRLPGERNAYIGNWTASLNS
jgi:hypothetical protein